MKEEATNRRDAGPAVRSLRLEPLTSAAFAPFGDVIDSGAAKLQFQINGGRATRFHDLAALVAAGDGGRLGVSLVRSQPVALPLPLVLLERHCRTSQAFVPLSGVPFAVVVSEGGDSPWLDTLRAFLAAPHQGVNYAPGTWHHPLLALGRESDFLTLDRIAPDGEIDCDEFALDAAGGSRWMLVDA